MADIGYFPSCEQYGPRELVAQAKAAERAGFDRLWISDHFHPFGSCSGWAAAKRSTSTCWATPGPRSGSGSRCWRRRWT
ncbi:LLM class flavin-dependent oxidoreductase [Pseudonocardia xishanensis]|uniref:LLM class flavin-dependent oxidoreductase n=1 Tax=Pseudonocardia xishanensis TaxID=630995 RepID=UPI0031F169B5